MENTLKKIASLFAIFNTVKEQIENTLCEVVNNKQLKTITIFYKENEKGITIKKDNISLLKLVNDRNLLELKFADMDGKWQTFNLHNIEKITNGKKSIIWSCEDIPTTEVKEVAPSKDFTSTNFDTCYYVIVNGEEQKEYKGIGIKGENYQFLNCIPSKCINEINDLSEDTEEVKEMEIINNVDFSKFNDSFGNLIKEFEVIIYNKYANGEWVEERRVESSRNYYIVDGHLYNRCNNSLLPLNMDFNSLTCGACYQIGKEIINNRKIIGNEILFTEKCIIDGEIKGLSLHKQSYSNNTCFYSLKDENNKTGRLKYNSHNIDELIEAIKLDIHLSEDWNNKYPEVSERRKIILNWQNNILNNLLKVKESTIKEEFYNNNEVVAAPEESIILDSNDSENNSNINMSLQLLALPNKELRPIFNTDIEGHEEYQKENLNLYNSNSLAFEKKRITNKMIEEYTKYFIYKDNRFMSVKPCKNIPYGYIEHVKNNRTLSVDTKNKIILCVEN